MACMGVGMVYLRQGNAAAAMPPLEQGLQVCHTFGFTALLFHGIAASLGAAYALVNRTAEAIPLLRKVADQAASMKLVSDHLLGAIPLGEALLSTGRIEDAAQLGRHALDLARQHKQRGHEVYALRLLGEVAAQQDPPDVKAAGEHYRSALALAHELGMRPLDRPLPPRPRQALPTHGRAGAGPRASHYRDDDVPRHGHEVLAGAGRGRDERGGVRTIALTFTQRPWKGTP